MQDTTNKQSGKKKVKPEWRAAAESYLRGEDGSEHRLAALTDEHQATALEFLAIEMSKNTRLAAADANRLKALLPRAPRQFSLALGAAMLGSGEQEAAESYLADGVAALENERLHANLSRGVSLERRLSVLEVIARLPLSDASRGAVLDLTSFWLRERIDGKGWPSTVQDIMKLHEVLCGGFRDALASSRAGSFWKAYTSFVPPKSLADSPAWRDLVSAIASGELSENLSAPVRASITSYLAEFREAKHGPSPGGQPAGEEPEVTVVPASAAITDQPTSKEVPVAEGVEERHGYLQRLRAGRAGLQKLAMLMEEVEQEHRLHQTARAERERARRELDITLKREAELVREAELLKRRAEEMEAKARAREGQRFQLEEALRLARGETAHFRDLCSERDADLSRSTQFIQELRDSLSGAQIEGEQLRGERDAIRREAAQLREDRDRIATEHDKNVDAERRLTTDGVLAEIRNRIGNVVSLQWESAFRLATTDDEREALELLKRRLVEITRGI